MADILIRKVDAGLKRKLKQRAQQHGHSMGEEALNILRDALKIENKREKGLGTRIAERFRGIGLDEPIPELRGFSIEPIKFDE
jgi:plasmid stability protein